MLFQLAIKTSSLITYFSKNYFLFLGDLKVFLWGSESVRFLSQEAQSLQSFYYIVLLESNCFPFQKEKRFTKTAVVF